MGNEVKATCCVELDAAIAKAEVAGLGVVFHSVSLMNSVPHASIGANRPTLYPLHKQGNSAASQWPSASEASAAQLRSQFPHLHSRTRKKANRSAEQPDTAHASSLLPGRATTIRSRPCTPRLLARASRRRPVRIDDPVHTLTVRADDRHGHSVLQVPL